MIGAVTKRNGHSTMNDRREAHFSWPLAAFAVAFFALRPFRPSGNNCALWQRTRPFPQRQPGMTCRLAAIALQALIPPLPESADARAAYPFVRDALSSLVSRVLASEAAMQAPPWDGFIRKPVSVFWNVD